MKSVLKFNLGVVICILGLFVSSCGTKKADTSDQTGKEYTSAYVCPMHCTGSGSDAPGVCPVCGMDYVKNESMTHACPMHPEVIGVDGDKCFKCGMALTPMQEEDHSSHNH